MTVSLHVLGCGDAVSAAGKHQAGYLVRGSRQTLLLDCGSMVLASMKRDGLDPDVIDAVLLSHLHGDHFAGVAFLMIEYCFEKPRTRPLQILGPPETEARVNDLLRATYGDLMDQPRGFALEFIELQPDVPYQLGDVRIEPFRVPHQQTMISLGLRVDIDGRSILYSGDTGWTEDWVARTQGVDLFLCECCYFETRQPFHLDYPRLRENRDRFGARRMVLTHLGRQMWEHRAEIDMELAYEGQVIEIP